MAMNKEHEKLYERLETRDGRNELFNTAKQRDILSKDAHQVRVIKSNIEETEVDSTRRQCIVLH